MRGTNLIRTPLKGNGETLEVVEIFQTLQGEGPLAGTPAVFVRLGGCNSACDFCDTEFENFTTQTLESVLPRVVSLAGGTHRLVVITGGEPFRQPIGLLCDRLLEYGLAVQVETNGTLFRPLDRRVSIVCSPKNTGKGYAKLREDILPQLSAIKFLLSASHPLYREVAEVGQTAHRIPVYVQPMDEEDPLKNQENLLYTLAAAQKQGYRLSLQLHKILGIA